MGMVKYMRLFFKIFVIILLLSTLTSCAEEKVEFNKYKILGKTEVEYLADIENCLCLIYAPKPGTSSAYVKRVLSKYMAEDVINKVVNWEGVAREHDIKCEVKYIGLAYGCHQRDGRTRVLAVLEVTREKILHLIRVELELNSSGQIVTINVF